MTMITFDPTQQPIGQWYLDFGDVVKKYIICNLRKNRLDEQVAEDLMQEVFLKAVRYMRNPAKNPVYAPKYWLFGIADNVCNNYRKTIHYNVVSFDTLNYVRENLPDTKSNQPEVLIFGEHPQLVGAFNKLPEEQRQATYHHYGEGLTHKEISQIYNRPPDKVGRDARSGLAQLKKEYFYPEEEY